MNYVTRFERMARREGIQEGLQKGRQESIWEGIIELLMVRFGAIRDNTAVQLKQVDDIDTLRTLRKKAITAVSLQEFVQAMPSSG